MNVQELIKKYPSEFKYIVGGIVAVIVIGVVAYVAQQPGPRAPEAPSSSSSDVYVESTSSSASGMALTIKNSADQYLDKLRSDFESRISSYEPRPVSMRRPRPGYVSITYALKDGSNLVVRYVDNPPYQRVKFIE